MPSRSSWSRPATSCKQQLEEDNGNSRQREEERLQSKVADSQALSHTQPEKRCYSIRLPQVQGMAAVLHQPRPVHPLQTRNEHLPTQASYQDLYADSTGPAQELRCAKRPSKIAVWLKWIDARACVKRWRRCGTTSFWA